MTTNRTAQKVGTRREELSTCQPSPDGFNIDLTPGQDFASMEQLQRSTFAFLPKLIMEAVVQGLKAGVFRVVDDRVVICDAGAKEQINDEL
ncbi:MAG: hypothetical protein KJ077_08630 [Anaerolineae bacterium]|nr:hypothetical protein [Anaerolineae bacterium]